MIVKRKDFRYPSLKEIRAIKDKIPKLPHFYFKYNSSLELGFGNLVSMEQAHRIGNLHEWDICLLNRFSKIRSTFEFLSVYYNRGVAEDFNSNSSEIIVNTILFEYYSEIFYYFYFSSLDIVAQIICLYYDPYVKEDKVAFNERFAKKYDKYILRDDLLMKTYNALKNARDCRNSFTHRYTPLLTDNRSSLIEVDKDKYAIGIGGGEKYDYDFILSITQEALGILSSFMHDLKAFLEKDVGNNTYLFD